MPQRLESKKKSTSSFSIHVFKSGKGRPPGERSKDALLPKKVFLKKYDIDEKTFNATKINWKVLNEIFVDYNKAREELNNVGQGVVQQLLSQEAKDAGVHSVKFRIKDPHGLIEKIIRRKILNPRAKDVTVENYSQEITDIIGVRALHVFKQDWYLIGNFITGLWHFKKTHKQPVVFHKAGDPEEFLTECKENNCIVKKHEKGYRSIHYIMEAPVGKKTRYVEIQVRTIFEEGWSEIDHRIRYSLKKQNSRHPLQEHLMILNTLSGGADELGMLIKRNKAKLEEEQYDRNKAKSKKKEGGRFA